MDPIPYSEGEDEYYESESENQEKPASERATLNVEQHTMKQAAIRNSLSSENISMGTQKESTLTIIKEESWKPDIEQKTLNVEQQMAKETSIKNVLGDTEKKSTLTIIQGGPGTGKTHVLSVITEELIRKDHHVLILTLTNHSKKCIVAAVNSHIKASEKKSTVMHSEKYEQMANSSSLNGLSAPERRKRVMYGTKVLIAIVGSELIKLSQNGTSFSPSVVLIDNIEQIDGSLTRPFFETIKRICVTIDPTRGPAAQLAENSSMKQAGHFPTGGKFATQICSLSITYQMNKRISSWFSERYFKKGFESHESVADQTLSFLPNIKESDRKKFGKRIFQPFVFCDTGIASKIIPLTYENCHEQTIDGSFRNLGEADIAVCHFWNLLKRGYRAEQIAMLAPYEKQKDAINSSLERFFDNGIPNVAVETVFSFHEQVRDVVILTVTRSNPIGEFDAFMDSNFFNTAISRAKRQIFIIGNLHMLYQADLLSVHRSLYNAIKNPEIGKIVSPEAVYYPESNQEESFETEKPNDIFVEGMQLFIKNCKDEAMKRKCVLKARVILLPSSPSHSRNSLKHNENEGIRRRSALEARLNRPTPYPRRSRISHNCKMQ